MFVTLLYHIINRSVYDKIAIAEEAFEAQLVYLQANDYTMLSLEQAIDILNGTQAAPQRSVLLTFDDGYEDNFSTALPLLRSYGMVATQFVISAYVGRSNRWNPKACYDVNHMTWDELRLWQQAGCSIGGHSHTHLCMSRLSETELHDEVARNKSVLEEHLQTPMRAFSYPYGAFTPLVQRVVSEQYEVAFAVDNGEMLPQTHLHARHRLTVSPKWDITAFAHHLERSFAITSALQELSKN